MQRHTWKTAKDSFVIIAALAITPLTVWATRARPLSASSLPELQEFVRQSRQEEILKPMTRRYEAEPVNFENASVRFDPQARWDEIQTWLQNSGVGDDQVREVIQAARPALKDAWPCFVERGYLQDQPVWVIVGSLPSYTGSTPWICPPSFQDIQEERIRKYCSNIQVAVVSANPPHSLLNRVARSHD
jgi:hypothetical protein